LNLPRKRKILCTCNPNPGETSNYRLQSFRRLGQDVTIFDIPSYQPRSKPLALMRSRMPVGPFVHRINRELLRAVRLHKPDVVWFDKPIYFTKETIETIRETGALTVCYNQDNPFGPRNDGCWYQFKRIYRLFDLHCLFRAADVRRYSLWGLPWIKTIFSFEPSIQFPPPPNWSETERNRGVSYIGSPHEERPAFLQQLAEKERLPVVISGPRWKGSLPPELVTRYVTDGFLPDAEYRKAIWRSRINLSFVTHSNEDDIGHKSVEIAACQGFLLALKTEGHQAIFNEDHEAVFFSSVEECAEKCRFYLERPDLRDAIARRGRERAVRSGYDNDTQLSLILRRLDGSADNSAVRS
jgi:spore maturation protein CgeB